MRAGRRVAIAVAAILVLSAGCLPASVRPTPVPAPTPTPSPPPTPTPSPTPGPPTPTPAPTFLLHTVVGGDTLTSLAKRYQTSGRSIAYWNRDEYPSLDPESGDYQPNNLKVGWVLRIMPGQEYTPPPDDGETGEQVSPTPDDFEDYETESPEVSASAGA
ncbi:MAG TPA: LysM domain-containing protein [Candidatus Limnocylindrales bacterium]|nr:LysM domain-containing protein [Candidatus Limnocylindrales bacterium]